MEMIRKDSIGNATGGQAAGQRAINPAGDNLSRWTMGAAMAMCLALAGAAQAIEPVLLTVGDRARPLNVEGAPLFGWMLASARGNDAQTAYQLVVTRPGGARVWDSGKVASSAQSYVRYAGPALEKGASYEWTIRTWDRDGKVSAYAPRAAFDTGLTDSGWSGAQWIRRVTSGNDSTDDFTLARKQFEVKASPVTRARIYAAAQGQYEIHVNGRTIGRGDNFNYPGEAQYYAFDITSAVEAGKPLVLGALYHYWTCTCQGRANGPAASTTLAAAHDAGATTLKVANVGVFDVGGKATIGAGAAAETVTVTAIGSAGAGGTGITVAPALKLAHAAKDAVTDHAGPSGLIMKAVIEHADGSRETYVTDGSWKVAKAAQYTNATITRRNGDAGDNAERYDARAELAGWDSSAVSDREWQGAYAIGAHPRPLNALRESFSHLRPAITTQAYETVRPVSVVTLADGSVVADFGKVMSAMPQLTFKNGVAGRAVSVLTSYRLNNTTLAAPAAAGDSVLKLTAAANLVVGDKLTVDQASAGFGAGDPEARTVTAIGADGAVTLDAPLARAHAKGRFVEGARAGTSSMDTQGSNLGWWYTQKDGPQTAQTFTYWGWRYLQVLPADGLRVGAEDIAAVVQHAEAPLERRATFASDNKTLDAVFALLQHSGIQSSEEVYLDTPTREKGQFLADSVDISYANMIAAGDRNASARAFREIIGSATHSWKVPSSFTSGTVTGADAANAGCEAAARVPCSYTSNGTPGRLNAVYPNGDNMRDIPDFTLMVPGWAWRYYEQSGDLSLLEGGYDALKLVAGYAKNHIAKSGNNAGLLTNLTGGTRGYQYGIIDWPAPMRYGYTFVNNASRTVHNAHVVGMWRAMAKVARALGKADDAKQFDGWADALTTTINAKLLRADGLYADGLSSGEGNPQIDNTAQHAQTYPVYYGVAPAASRAVLADKIVKQGMNQGPMTWHILLKALTDLGRYDQVVKLMTDENADGPARLLAQRGTFMWEQWNPGCAAAWPCNPSGDDSQSHGWGAWGIVDMVESLLGVSVASPGAADIRIVLPALDKAPLNQVSGSAWTQRGTVKVAWKRAAGGFTLDIDVPVNVKAQVLIPNAAGLKYVGSGAGKPVSLGQREGRAVFSAGSGQSRFEVK